METVHGGMCRRHVSFVAPYDVHGGRIYVNKTRVTEVVEAVCMRTSVCECVCVYGCACVCLGVCARARVYNTLIQLLLLLQVCTAVAFRVL